MEEKKKRKYYGYTRAHAEANARYLEKFEFIKIRATPAEKEQIKTLAAAEGKSVNTYILDLALRRSAE